MQTFTFISKDGKMTWGSVFNHARFRQHLKENEGKVYQIKPIVLTRSLSQNALYHLFLDVICRDTGNNHNDLHEYFKREFLPPKIIKVKIKGQEIDRKIPSSTTGLNKIEFTDYLDRISALTETAIPDTKQYQNYIDEAPLK